LIWRIKIKLLILVKVKWQTYRDCLAGAYVKIGNTIELLSEKREEEA
jgi:hypothetical protein